MDYYPRLVESNIRSYLHETLHKCHQHKATMYVWTFNIGLFLLFTITLGLILYFRRRTQDIPEYEKEAQSLKTQNYILSKIRDYQNYEKRKRQESSMITDLPFTYDPNAGLEFPP
jgi:hypothetical protein